MSKSTPPSLRMPRATFSLASTGASATGACRRAAALPGFRRRVSALTPPAAAWPGSPRWPSTALQRSVRTPPAFTPHLTTAETSTAENWSVLTALPLRCSTPPPSCPVSSDFYRISRHRAGRRCIFRNEQRWLQPRPSPALLLRPSNGQAHRRLWLGHDTCRHPRRPCAGLCFLRRFSLPAVHQV